MAKPTTKDNTDSAGAVLSGKEKVRIKLHIRMSNGMRVASKNIDYRELLSTTHSGNAKPYLTSEKIRETLFCTFDKLVELHKVQGSRPYELPHKTTFLHLGSHRSAKICAILISFVETFKLEGISIVKYFMSFFEVVCSGRTDSENLLPATISLPA